MGDAKTVIELAITLWNAHDRAGLSTLVDPSVEIEGPGGLSLSGTAGWDAFYDTWNEAFPDNSVDASAFASGDEATEEGTFSGTHTGTLHGPGGDLPPTGRRVNVPYAITYRVSNDRITSAHLYFDQVDLLTQLGVMPEPAAAAH